MAGTCTTLVLEARVLTDPSVPLSSSLPKHYTLHMLDTAIFIGSVRDDGFGGGGGVDAAIEQQ